ncbi:DUF4399 domain-containing protein [Paraburkholderia phytofirmans]|jgi:Domain of unknown function (DUF4399)|uniref:DUF4399 domain-containing protein n=1 Tax=Paraburkholderia phytofirmans OLGA172 TaxID=1417228 RepID=A0A167WJE0_9BURK|nr:DUF4399 domain-containing protein [Paraburkholderia phytofirmans]ANB77097.1 hypothetical protein AYM40_33840 [Paraburkholderia phytofirmans OLGA172]
MRRTLRLGVLDIRQGTKAALAASRIAWCATLFLLLGIASLSGSALAEQTPSPPGAEEYIIWPSDGAVIHGGKLWVRMGLRNMGVCPKGVAVPNTGHHHLLIDTDLPPLDQEIPSDRNHLHFGAGETDARIELPPGKHTLQLILGDHNHVPHVPPVYSKKITITVLKD